MKLTQKSIYVFADWSLTQEPELVGSLFASQSRGKEIFSFGFDESFIHKHPTLNLDPNLLNVVGPQYSAQGHANFGLFLDAAPDRWGRVLMRRREVKRALDEKRASRTLMESDFLLGVFDGHRLGGLRFKAELSGPFLDNDYELASPPWAKLSDLEYASLQLERADVEHDKEYGYWLKLLIAPGGSLGGARPKASVLDEQGNLWIAKFPSRGDDINIGAWEYLVHRLAKDASIEVPEAQLRRFNGPFDTFLSRRFDRNAGGRMHFASAMTLAGNCDGDDADTGASYLDLVQILMQSGAQTNIDLEQLWRRIVFNVCISNVDDHLRNHGFLLAATGWKLSPAYDLNPVASGNGLKLNISKNDNSQNLELCLSVAPYFRISKKRAQGILDDVVHSVRKWKKMAPEYFSRAEISKVQSAFRVVEN